MASPHSLMTVYNSPTLGRPRMRRDSSRKSSCTTFSDPASQIEPARPNPADGDTFSYDSVYLRSWYCSQAIWEQLPDEVQDSLSAFQHSGAAVLSGFARLEKHEAELEDGRVQLKLNEDELMVQLETLPSPKLRSPSITSSVVTNPSPTFTGSPTSNTASPSNIYSNTMSPISPICLTPSEPTFTDKHMPPRERSFTTPMEPHDAYYTTELSALRTEAIPRLRHAARKVDTEWYEAKRTGSMAPGDVNDFENFWAEKKCNVLSLTEEGNRLSAAIGLSPTGMGWSAP